MTNISFMERRGFISVLLIVAIACGSKPDKKQSGDKVITYTIVGDKQTGFSYQIFISEKLFIDQTEIPAVGGMQKFTSGEEAEMVARLVITKLGKSGLPSVTINELDSLNITYNKIPLQ